MEGDLPSDTFDVEKEGGGEADYPLLLIELSVFLAYVNRFLQSRGGKGMFSDKPPVNAGDASAAINKGVSVNSFQGVRWFDKLNWNLHRWGSLYIDRSTLYTREDSYRRSFPI